jgi:SAM-dependent methyltransferase
LPAAQRPRAPAADTAGLQDVLRGIESYYCESFRLHGATPRGVDWESLATQQMRFVQLLKICDWDRAFSLNDLGCGYGALLELLRERHSATPVDYLGIDLSAPMIAVARRRWKARAHTSFAVNSAASRTADYSVASGIFNVKLHQPLELWTRFIRETLQHLHATSQIGFAVNFLLEPPADSPFAPELYAAAPGPWIAFCESLGARVHLIEGYGMQEFTLLVRRS